MPFNYVTLDVFTTTPYKGNPLAVVFLDPTSPAPTQAQKQRIAQEFNYSETVFLHPPPTDTHKNRKIDIFTTTSELTFAGHPTIGTAVWLLRHSEKQIDREVETLVTKAGDIPIHHHISGEGCVAANVAHNVHVHSKRFPLSDLLRLHSSLREFFTSTQKHGGGLSFPIFSVVNGMSQVLVEVPSLAALGAAKTSAGGEVLSPEQYLDEGWKTGKIVLYFFVRGSRSGSQTEKRLTKIRTRAVLGDLEDPGTGSAASGLGSYLALAEGVDGEYGYEITQGVEMGRQSEIGVSVWVKDRKIEQVQLRGSAVRVMEGRILA